MAAWDTATRKEAFNIHLGDWDAVIHLGSGAGAMTGAGTVLLPGGCSLLEGTTPLPQEVRFGDGKSRPVLRARGSMALWVDAGSQDALCVVREFEGYKLEAGKLPPFVADPKRPAEKAWVTTPLKPAKGGYEVRAATARADLKRLAVVARGDDDSALSVYDVTVGEELLLAEVATVPTGQHAGVYVLLFSRDGKVLATGGGDSSVCLWDVTKAGKDWKPRAVLPLGDFTVSCLAFSPDGSTLAAGTFDKKGRPNLYLIDVQSGKLVGKHRANEEPLTAVAFSPDGKTLVTGDNLGLIRAWDSAALRE